MAKEARKVNPKFRTGIATAVYPKLTEPDYGTKEHPDPEGKYKTKLRMSKEEAEALLDKKVKQKDDTVVSLREVHAQAIADGQIEFDKLPVGTRKKLGELKEQPLYSEVYDKETEEPTGEVEFLFKKTASGTRKDGKKWTAKPDLFDAKGQLLGKGVAIWGGSKIKVNFEASSYFVAGQGMAGVSLRMNAVQIIELVSAGGRSASDYGFEEEDGFEYDPEDYKEEADGASEGGSEGSAEDKTPADGDDDF